MTASKAQDKLKEGQEHLFSKPPDYAQSTALFREVTELAPDWSEGYLWLGIALLESAKLKEAESMFRQTIKLCPTDSRSHLWLGHVLERMGKFSASIRSYRDGLDLKPHYGEADARINLADVLKKAGRIKEAVIEWQIVARMSPMYPSYDEPLEEAKRQLQSHEKKD